MRIEKNYPCSQKSHGNAMESINNDVWCLLKEKIYDIINEYKYFHIAIEKEKKEIVKRVTALWYELTDDEDDIDDKITTISPEYVELIIVRDTNDKMVYDLYIQNFLIYVLSYPLLSGSSIIYPMTVKPIASDLYINFCVREKIFPLISKLLKKYNNLFTISETPLDKYSANIIKDITKIQNEKSILMVLSGLRLLFQFLSKEQLYMFIENNNSLCLISTEYIKQYDINIILSTLMISTSPRGGTSPRGSGTSPRQGITSPRQGVNLIKSILVLCQEIDKTVKYYGENEYELTKQFDSTIDLYSIIENEYIQMCLMLEAFQI